MLFHTPLPKETGKTKTKWKKKKSQKLRKKRKKNLGRVTASHPWGWGREMKIKHGWKSWLCQKTGF